MKAPQTLPINSKPNGPINPPNPDETLSLGHTGAIQGASNKLTRDEREELERLRAENESLKLATVNRITIKIIDPRRPGTNGDKDLGCKGGTLGIYGIRKFPFAFYAKEILTILDRSEEIKAIIQADMALPYNEQRLMYKKAE